MRYVFKKECLFCHLPYETTETASKFCTRSCAAKHNMRGRVRTEESKKKTSRSMRIALGLPEEKSEKRNPRRERKAPRNPDDTGWRYGPYLHKTLGYMYYTDRLDTGKQVMVYVHREVMGDAVGRKLKTEEVVHHENEKKTANDKENLSLITAKDHSTQHTSSRGREWALLRCPTCRKEFSKAKNRTHLEPSRSGRGTWCSLSCARQFPGQLKAEEAAERLVENIVRTFRKFPEEA